MTPTSPERIRQDSRLLGQTLLKLALPRLALWVVIAALAVVIWLIVASWLHSFGLSLRFDSMQTLGPQTVDFLNRVNPYVWWGVIAAWTLIVFFCARGWIRSSMAANRARMLDPALLAELRPQLSEGAVEVLRWAWGARREPFTVGDLQRAYRELRRNRVAKIALVHEQSAALDQPAGPGSEAQHAEPSLSQPR